MRLAKCVVAQVVLSVALGTHALAQEPLPTGAFKTVHLVTLTTAEEASLLGALSDLNAAVAAAGHPEIRYRVYKVAGKQSGSYNYLWESSWPGADVYDRIHKSPAYQAAAKKHDGMDALMKGEVYNRYVEVAPPKR